MKLTYTGPRKKEFGVVGPATGTRYTVRPGEPLDVPEADGQAILSQFPTLFELAAPEPRRRGGKVEPARIPVVGEPGPELFMSAADPETPEE